MWIISFNPQNSPLRWVLLLSMFYQWEELIKAIVLTWRNWNSNPCSPAQASTCYIIFSFMWNVSSKHKEWLLSASCWPQQFEVSLVEEMRSTILVCFLLPSNLSLYHSQLLPRSSCQWSKGLLRQAGAPGPFPGWGRISGSKGDRTRLTHLSLATVCQPPPHA